MNSPEVAQPESAAAAAGEPTVARHDAAAEFAEEIERHEPRNLLSLAFHHIVLRIAWVFKTESVIMPAFVDAISGAGWVRGCLPLLNRIGQSVPSLMLADRIRRTKYKKWAVLTTSWMMAVPFLTISVIWFALDEKRQPWLAGVFLMLYFLFFIATGLNQLSFGTAQGKLIRPERRGRLMGLAGVLGSIPAILCAWFLLQRWLKLPDGGFGWIFGFTGTGFVVAGTICCLLVEPPDEDGHGRRRRNPFRDAWTALRVDADFRRFCIVGVMFMTSQMLFPHYQALGRNQANFTAVSLMVWVVAQNAGAGGLSLIMGAIADRLGNRIVLRIEIFLGALTPLLALLMAGELIDGVDGPFWVCFVLLAFVPVTVKTMVNYTLEICEPNKHAQYISTLKVCMAVPFVLSPLIGLLTDQVGFGPVFGGICALIVVAGLLTFRIPEPRVRLNG